MAITHEPLTTQPRAQRGSTAPLIADHGLIGDLQTAALVATDGTVDWYCCPRFDAPGVFARILDHARGGYFRVAPENQDCVVKQLYFPDTAVLITRFMSEEGVCELVDFMPIADDPKQATDRHRIVRMVRGIRGEMRLNFECAPRFDSARGQHAVAITEHGAVLNGGNLQLTLEGLAGLERAGDDVGVSRTVRANETIGVILESAADS